MNKKFIIASCVFGFIIAINSLFVVDQRKQALIFQFGKIVETITEPGLNFKLPMIQSVSIFDKMILNLTVEEKDVIAKDQKRLIVNAFAKYRIADPVKYYQTVRDESGIKARLGSILESSLRQIIGDVLLTDLLTDKRGQIMKSIQQLVNLKATSFGVEVIDVRILRADLPKENSDAVYKRMRTDREKEAKEIRAEGAEQAQKIKSMAEYEQKVITADAEKESEIIRGEGDSTSSKIFADAYNKDPEFYSFYRSLQAYRSSLKDKNTKVILSSDSPFLNYFN